MFTTKIFPDTSHDALVILTDLEPDDVLAIGMLLKNVSSMIPLLVIVGEGNVDKTAMGIDLIKKLGHKNFKLFQGEKSEKEFPTLILDLFDGSLRDKVDYDFNIKNVAEIFLSKSLSPLIFSIKSPREIMNIDRNLLGKSFLAQYGSFNFRSMFNDYDQSEISNFINNSFKGVILYESYFATGHDNSINSQNASKLFLKIRNSNHPYLKVLWKMIQEWNNYISHDCLQTASVLTKDMLDEWQNQDRNWEKLKQMYNKLVSRNLKVISSIIEAQNEQMVFADFGLVVTLLSSHFDHRLEKGEIEFSDLGYTTFNPSDNGRVLLVKDVNFDQVVNKITDIVYKSFY